MPFVPHLDDDGNIDDDMGADWEGGTINFNYDNGDPSGFTSGLADVYYYVLNDGKTLVGSTADPNTSPTEQDIDDGKVFTVNLSPDGALGTANDTYSFTLHQQIDGGIGEFNTDLGTL